MKRPIRSSPVAALGLCLAALACQESPPPGPHPDLRTVAEKEIRPIGVHADAHLVYVPAYSHVYVGDRNRRFQLTCTLSVRNTSLQDTLELKSVRYYDSHGSLVYDYLHSPSALRPMATYEVVVAERDTTGGSGANFLVEWTGPDSTPHPIIETVMVGASSTTGVSFISRGTNLKAAEIPRAFLP